MVRIRHGWLVAALALGVSVGACKKDEKQAAPAGETAAGSTKTEKAAGGAAATSGASDLSLLPVDSEAVIGLNFAQLRGSDLWKKFVEPQLMKGDAQQKFAELKEKCGFDPIASVTSMSMGLKGLGGGTPDGVIVVHGTDKGKVLSCIDKSKAEIEKDGTKVTTEDGVVTMAKGDETFAFTYVNDSTLVAVVGQNANTAGVKAAAAGNSALKDSPTFVEMHGKINTKDSLWLLVNGKVLDEAPTAAMGVKPVAVFGSINVTDGLAMDMRARLESADQAAQLAGMAKGQLGMLQQMVDKVDVANDGSDVKVHIVISSQKLQQLITQFGGMMGGM